MTPIVQLRKDPRTVSDAPQGQFRRTSQIPATHIPASVMKILGLKSAS